MSVACEPTTTKVEESAQPTRVTAPENPARLSQRPPAFNAPVHEQSAGIGNTLPTGHPKLGGQQLSKRDSSSISGTVTEQIPAGKYLYLRLKTSNSNVWTAVLKESVQTGAVVTVVRPHKMTQFQSPSLGRTFEEIYFGTLAPRISTSASAEKKASKRDSRQKPSSLMPKAVGTNGLHINELYRARTQWAGKKVSIRGMVVKFNAEILGANWIHIQDGSGSAGESNNDLVVTTQAKSAVGDDIVVEGVVALDRDFGAGYSYGLMIEDATVTIQAK